jgi:lipase
MNPDEGYVDANGLSLHYLRWRTDGGGVRPAIVLLHATGFLARLWQPVAEALASRFDVYAYDTRGHGDSDKPPPDGENYHWRNLVADLRGFCDALGLRASTVVHGPSHEPALGKGPEPQELVNGEPGVAIAGHSSGGAAAAYLAATHPEYVSRLVLFEPIIFPAQFLPPEDRRNELADGARKRRRVWSDTDEIIEAYRTRPAFARWRADVLRLYAEHGTFQREDGQVELKCPGEVEAEVFDHSRSLDTWEQLPEITCPALVMHGELTPEPFPSLMAQFAQRIPNARLETVPDAGHLAPMERPEPVAQAILSLADEDT